MSLKKQWEKELDSIVPRLSCEIKKESINLSKNKIKQNKIDFLSFVCEYKKFLITFFIISIFIVGLLVLLPLLKNNKKDKPQTQNYAIIFDIDYDKEFLIDKDKIF